MVTTKVVQYKRIFALVTLVLLMLSFIHLL
jgi:hypothetical protein